MRINEAAWLDKYNRWQIKVQKEGVRKTFTSSTPGKKGKIECEKKADKWLEKGTASSNLRFGAAYKEYCDYTKEVTSLYNWQQRDSIGRNWLIPELEHKKLTKITAFDLQKCIDNCYKAGRAWKTISDVRGCITSFASFAKRKGWEFADVELLTIPNGAKEGVRTILQPDILNKLMYGDFDNWYINAFRFIVLTGLRRGELCGLKFADIENDNLVHIQRSITDENTVTQGKTKNAKRTFIMCNMAKSVLETQKQQLKLNGIISPYVFPKSDGKRTKPTILYHHWYNFRETIGANCSLHELRHTLVSYASRNVPEVMLKRIVGHSKTMDTYGVYSHQINGELETVAAMLDETFNDVLSGL